MIRLDKYLTLCGIGTRSIVKKCIRRGLVLVNDNVVKNDDLKIDEEKDVVIFDGEKLNYQKNIYLVMNKPGDCICSTDDEEDGTIINDLLDDFLRHRKLFPVGRLDKDTEGLLILTDDGDFCHKVISPKKNIPKTYYVEYVGNMSEKEMQRLREGVKIGDYTTLPAKVKKAGEQALEIIITEGKYHQVKLMLEALGNRVTYLKRIKIGDFDLPELGAGEYRELTEEEKEKIFSGKF